MLSAGVTGSLEWAVAEQPYPGELQSGDAFVVLERPAGPVVAVIDGLGHGPEAAQAARTAVDALRGGGDRTVAQLVSHCSKALGSTRGAVMALAAFDDAHTSVTWIGVGNVAAILVVPGGSGALTTREVVQRGATLGTAELRLVRPITLPAPPGAVLVVATDGVRSEFRAMACDQSAPASLAAELLSRYATATDDALVLVARFVGAP